MSVVVKHSGAVGPDAHALPVRVRFAERAGVLVKIVDGMDALVVFRIMVHVNRNERAVAERFYNEKRVRKNKSFADFLDGYYLIFGRGTPRDPSLPPAGIPLAVVDEIMRLEVTNESEEAAALYDEHNPDGMAFETFVALYKP